VECPSRAGSGGCFTAVSVWQQRHQMGSQKAGRSFFLYARPQMTLTSTVSCMDTRCSQRAFLLPRHRLGDSTALSLAAVPQCPSQIWPSPSPDATPAYLCYRSCIEYTAYRRLRPRCIPPRALSHWSPYHALEGLQRMLAPPLRRTRPTTAASKRRPAFTLCNACCTPRVPSQFVIHKIAPKPRYLLTPRP
jgi:hypothetical protein